MAITPIDLFQDKGGSIVGRMLTGGTSIFGDAIHSLIGVGRDLANNQVRQERDFLQERRNEESLMQRRAENVQQQANTDRAFTENLFRDRRDTSREIFEDERDFKRTVARDQQDLAGDLFSQGMRAAEFGQREEDNRLQRDRFQLQKDDLEAERRFNEGVVKPKEEAPVYGPLTPEQLFAEAEIEAEAAKELRDPDAYRAAVKKGAQAKAAAGTRGTTDTAAARRAEEGLEMRRRTEARTLAKEQAAAAEEEAKALLADGTAFRPQLESLPKETKTDSPEYLAAYNFDKDRFAAERSVATAVSKEEYVAKGEGNGQGAKLDPTQKKRRARFWELVNGQKATAASGTGNAAAEYVRGVANMK